MIQRAFLWLQYPDSEGFRVHSSGFWSFGLGFNWRCWALGRYGFRVEGFWSLNLKLESIVQLITSSMAEVAP